MAAYVCSRRIGCSAHGAQHEQWLGDVVLCLGASHCATGLATMPRVLVAIVRCRMRGDHPRRGMRSWVVEEGAYGILYGD